MLKHAIYCPVLLVTQSYAIYAHTDHSLIVTDMETGDEYYCDNPTVSNTVRYTFTEYGGVYRVYALADQRQLKLQVRFANKWETTTPLDISEYDPLFDGKLPILLYTNGTGLCYVVIAHICVDCLIIEMPLP